MADSDDDFDRRRRDKFTRERNDYRDRRDYDRGDYGRGGGGRGDYGGRGGGGDYDRRRAYSPLRGRDSSPPIPKRSRYDSDSLSTTGGSGQMGTSQPAMLTFKQFLASQDDCIDDQDAVKKYADYKADFKRQQLEEFFKAHKDEEWFRLKYHPDECQKRKEELKANIQNRLEVYKKLRDMGILEKVELDVEKNDDIIRVMDTVAILLEGGTDEDLKALDEPEPELKPHILEPVRDVPKAPAPTDGAKNAEKKDGDAEASKDEAAAGTEGKEKSGEDSGLSDNEDEMGEEGKKEKDGEDGESGDEGNDDKDDEGKSKKKKEKTTEGDDAAASDSERKDTDADKENDGEDAEMKEEIEEKKDESAEESKEDTKPKGPRHLHRTSSIFLRTLSPAITKQEVEAMCRNYSGFLRVALAEPQPERKFLRRGWITFERHVNTKEICWKLNNIRLRDTELGAILNRDLSRRVRSVNGIVSAKTVMKADMKLAAKVIQNLDTQRGLWMEDGAIESNNPLLKNIADYLIEEASAEEEELLGQSEDGKDEGEEGAVNTNGAGAGGLEKDAELAKALDRLLWYLRIVHSFDYYSHGEYHNEDEMPNRCGIIHARGSVLPTSQVSPKEMEEYSTQFEQKIAPYADAVKPISHEEAKKLGLKTEDEEVEKFMNANCQELAKDKYVCPLSGKKFKAPEFVHKHILNRHGEKLEEVKKDAAYYNNYVKDPKRPMLPEHPTNKPRSGTGSSGAPLDNNGAGGMMAGPYGGGHYGAAGPYGYPPGRPGGGYGPPGYGGGPPMRGYGGGPPMDPYGPYGGGPRGYGSKRGPPFGGGGPRGMRDPRPVVGYHDLDAPPDFDQF